MHLHAWFHRNEIYKLTFRQTSSSGIIKRWDEID